MLENSLLDAHRRVARALAHMQEHIKEPFSLDAIAAQAAVSPDDFRGLDAAELALPLLSEAVPPIYRQYSPVQQALADKIAQADGFLVVTTKCNHSLPASLKNLLDYVWAEWNRKPFAYRGYGTTGAICSMEHLIQIVAFLGGVSVRDTVGRDPPGRPRPEKVKNLLAET